MNVQPMVRRCTFCKTVMGIVVTVIDLIPHDELIIQFDFETQQVPETTGMCEFCLRNKVHKIKPQQELIGLAQEVAMDIYLCPTCYLNCPKGKIKTECKFYANNEEVVHGKSKSGRLQTMQTDSHQKKRGKSRKFQTRIFLHKTREGHYGLHKSRVLRSLVNKTYSRCTGQSQNLCPTVL